ncbi:MAG: hypothetical protein RLZZ53_3415 [Acidobacteriota bacterium]|jgi:hypothetical protein
MATQYQRRRLLLFAIVIALAVPLALQAQRVPKRIFVSAVDENGRPVLDLTAAEFRITENGTRRDVTRATLGTAPMRIVLLCDSGTSMSPILNTYRVALNGFVDLLPPEFEVAFVSSGGQIRVRTQPSTDREKLRAEIARFVPEGGANAFFETLLESDQRFLQKSAEKWPVFVVVGADTDTRTEPDVVRYNTFMNNFLSRGGAAHVVMFASASKRVGAISDIASNLVQNTNGLYFPIVTESALPDKLTTIAERLVEDHRRMADRYEVEFTGNAQWPRAVVNIESTRRNVQLEMSPRRP